MTYSEFTVCTVLRSTVHSVTVCQLSSGAQSLCGDGTQEHSHSMSNCMSEPSALSA